MEGGLLEQRESAAGIEAAKEQEDDESRVVEDFLKTKIGRGQRGYKKHHEESWGMGK